MSTKSKKPQKCLKNRKNALRSPYGEFSTFTEELNYLNEICQEINSEELKVFDEFPISTKTKEGLKKSNYIKPTEIQHQTVCLGLQNLDVLGAAKTGSGKTLAFLIPLIECLYKSKWTRDDGVGAVVISPTRELAYQSFEVLKKIGRFHDFSAGLAIGGKFIKEESACINRTNIVICTPGRLLHHMDATPNFNLDGLQILVLDEADKILDQGFKKTMAGIIENLPSTRQTLLFSATQTKSVKELVRLSLKDPVYVSIHENAQQMTPTNLRMTYMIVGLDNKINVIWSFLNTHKYYKILIFINTCKQVRYIHESFQKLRPGIPLLALHSNMNQLKRVNVYEQFCKKRNVALFATDIAARGLDFSGTRWVIQMDCPKDATTYIHRVGRTARYEEKGDSLLLVTPTEATGMIKQLEDQKIVIKEIKMNPAKLQPIEGKLERQCADNNVLKEYAQRAFIAYIKSIYFMKNKEVFKVQNINLEHFSSSLGLVVPPNIRFLTRAEKMTAADSKNDDENKVMETSKAEEDRDEEKHFGETRLLTALKLYDAAEVCEKQSRELLEIEEKSKRQISRESQAQKLLRKQIRLNQITTFDEVDDSDNNEKDSSQASDALVLQQNQDDGTAFLLPMFDLKGTRLRETSQKGRKSYIEKIRINKQDRRAKQRELKKRQMEERKQKLKHQQELEEYSDSEFDEEEINNMDVDDSQCSVNGSEECLPTTSNTRKHNSEAEIVEPRPSEKGHRKKKRLHIKDKEDQSTLQDAEQLAMMFLN